MNLLSGLAVVHIWLAWAPGMVAGEWPEARLTSAELGAHLRFLASDELKGRRTGTAEHDIAARYIAERFREAGVQPTVGDSYLQQIPLHRSEPAESAKLKMLGRELQNGTDFLVMSGEPLETSAPRAFLGYGLKEEGSSQDLYADVQGKIVVVQSGKPGNPRPGRGTSLEKRRLAHEAGAVALIELYPARLWDFVHPFLSRPRLALATPESQAGEDKLPYIVMKLPDAELIGNLQAVPEAAIRLQSSGVGRTPVQAANVAGLIRGSSHELRDEYVVLTAHYDHLGADPHLPGSTQEDFIFNGARDNGMGVTALLGAAKALAEQPPERSILLLAVTAEESGLLGSRFYVDTPIVPLRQTVFVLNVDGGLLSDTDVVTVVGLLRTSASGLIEAASRRFGLEAIPGPPDAQSFFDRSDNLNFARKGVPAPTFSPGFKTLQGSAMKHYHRPSDEAGEDFNYAYLLAFCQAYAATARAVADSPERPRWTEGDPYAEAATELYGTPR